MTAHYRHDPVLHDLDKHLSDVDNEIAKSEAISERAAQIHQDIIDGGFTYNGALYTMADIVEKIMSGEKSASGFDDALAKLARGHGADEVICFLDAFGLSIAAELAELELNEAWGES